MGEKKLTALGLIRVAALLHAYFFSISAANKCRPSSCGDIPIIRHPFRLKGDPSSCGYSDPAFELVCKNNRTILHISGGEYYVVHINYGNYTIRIVIPGLQNGNCFSYPLYPLRSRQVLFPFALPREWNTVLFMNCTRPISSPNYVQITPCNSRNASSFSSQPYSYALVRDSLKAALIQNYPCTFGLTVITQIWKGVSEPKNRSMLNLQENLLMGLELSFSSIWEANWFAKFVEFLKDYFRWVIAEDFVHGSKGFKENNRREFEYLFMSEVDNVYKLLIIGKWIIWMTVIIGGRAILGILCLIAYLIFKFRRRHLSLDDSIEEFLQNHKTLQPIRYSYSEIRKMTKNFKNKLGQGGFGAVYKGKLRSGRIVAVKVLAMSKSNGQDFINEIATIGRIHHVNVVRLIGFCANGSKWALIYDFMPNGSLDKYVFLEKENSVPLSWEMLYKIALGAARGVDYLHRGCDMQILHFDIKPHNILLDENFTPKISDFGLAKLYSTGESIVSLTAARGTLGYIAPELFYKSIGGISYKADVYSFGMLLMEMVGRRKNLNPYAEESSQIYFPSWIYDRYDQGEEMEMGDAAEDEKKYVRKMVIAALWCIQLKPVDRPSMSKVVEMLEAEVGLLEMPRRPALYTDYMSVENNGNNPIIAAATSSYNSMGTITLGGR